MTSRALSRRSTSAMAASTAFTHVSFSKRRDSTFRRWQNTLEASSDLARSSFIPFNMLWTTDCVFGVRGWLLCGRSMLAGLLRVKSDDTDIELEATP